MNGIKVESIHGISSKTWALEGINPYFTRYSINGESYFFWRKLVFSPGCQWNMG